MQWKNAFVFVMLFYLNAMLRLASTSAVANRKLGGDELPPAIASTAAGVQVAPYAPMPPPSSTLLPHSDGHDGGMLSRLNERLAMFHTLGEQQLKKLEAVEYRITRIEVSNQEKIEALRTELREVSRRVQNVDWLVSKTEGGIDQTHADLEAIRQTLAATSAQCQTGTGSAAAAQSPAPVDVAERLNALAKSVSSARVAVHRVERACSKLADNVTELVVTVRDVATAQRSVATKQFLNNALASLKSQPVYAVVQQDASTATQRHHTRPPLSCGTHNGTAAGNLIRMQSEHNLRDPFYVRCNKTWTVILHREDGSINFHRNWMEYRNGFGNLNGDFWIGLEKLHELTSSTMHELLIVLDDFDEKTVSARYAAFAIGGEKDGYALTVLGNYDGDAGDSLTYQAGHKFSTFDLDNDAWQEGNCAQAHHGAWWYNACDTSNLMGRYMGGEYPEAMRYQGMYWHDFRGSNYSLKRAQMMIRPVV